MKNRIPLPQVRAIAEELVTRLAPYCERLEIAGSIRREKAEVGDIELVAMPRYSVDMFGAPGATLLEYVEWGEIGALGKNGPKYKQIALAEGVTLDLFIVTPPAQWGVQFLIRTGPGEFSKRIVTPRMHGGLCPNYLRFQDGAIWSSNHTIDTPEEQDVFDLLGMDYIEPRDRR